ncbi:hypothetical protein MPSEU_000604800 [Mayamaea pseudoterrestris]|nr:hypothetical protein MPSEU_000604800 [Mayamaea pseudoterrestris]
MSASGRGEDTYLTSLPGRSTRAHGNSSQAAAQAATPPSIVYPIVITDSDVLCGRGNAIASHAGCLRFRKLVSSHTDESYISSYKTIEKRAVADQIISHIKNLNPPGRFLTKPSKNRSTKLEGPWEELTYEAALKKTVQALRDANREDRSGYAVDVPVPEDVKQHQAKIERRGLTKRQFAKEAALDFVAKRRDPSAALTPGDLIFSVPDPTVGSPPASPPDFASIGSSQWTNSSPEIAAAAAAVASYSHLPSVTPATAARAPHQALFEDDRKMPAQDPFFHADALSTPHPDVSHSQFAFQDSPHDSGEESFANAFRQATSGPSQNDSLDVMAASAAAGLDESASPQHHHALAHHHASDNDNDYSSLFHDVDDEAAIAAEHAFDDPKY